MQLYNKLASKFDTAPTIRRSAPLFEGVQKRLLFDPASEDPADFNRVSSEATSKGTMCKERVMIVLPKE